MHGNPLSAGFDPGDRANALDERQTVMRTGAAHEGAVDIEKYEQF